MERVELMIEKKKAAKLISFLKELDFVEVKQTKKKKKTSAKNLDDILIPATNPSKDISSLFGVWKNMKIDSADIRNGSRRKEQLQW